MTFPGTLWKVQNPDFQVQIFEYLKKTSRFLGPKSSLSDLNFGFSGSRFGFPRSNFRNQSAERARFETSKNRSLGIDPNRLESVQGPRKRLGFEVSRAGRPIRPQIPSGAFFLHEPVWRQPTQISQLKYQGCFALSQRCP